VTAIEIEPVLAARAGAALLPWPQVTVINADGSALAPGAADVIIVNGGATHPLPAWLDALNEGGRLLLPLTGSDRWGGILLVTRMSAAAYAARFLRPAGFIHFSGARDPDIGRRLAAAFGRDRGVAVKSLRRAPAQPDASCWLAGADWWLSTAAV
jgi:protein-L-isoaspartate(D-aspartate) O-methyltransferase